MQIISSYLNQLYPLPISIQQRIDESCDIIQFDRNDSIDIIGKTPEHFLLLKSGIVKSFRRTSTSTLITGFKGPGESLYHVNNLFKHEPSEEGFKVVNDTVAVALPYRVIHEIYSKYPDFLLQLLKLIDIKLLDLQKHAYILSQTMDQRILFSSKYFSRILPEIPKTQFCQFLCMSRTTLYDFITPRNELWKPVDQQ
ncbi:Crp/Fnr family transcriptional regulator [Puia dinghuensis]|uniref:Crp/Fnr family transcriptional regulator n=1 Tax=Puia dinghuensis TaxID=1792502 RepID=UPI00166D95B2|nr:Crp/Fnr family transcriptional regulator [Puia dinghuensis]